MKQEHGVIYIDDSKGSALYVYDSAFAHCIRDPPAIGDVSQQLNQLVSCQQTSNHLQLPKKILNSPSDLPTTHLMKYIVSSEHGFVVTYNRFVHPHFDSGTIVLASFNPLVNDILLDATKSTLCHVFTLTWNLLGETRECAF